MSAIAGGMLLAGGCVALMRVFRIPGHALEALEGARTSARVLASTALCDDQKEIILKRQTQSLIYHFIAILIGGGASIAVPLLAVGLLDALALSRFDEALDTATSWWFILSTLAILSLIEARRRSNGHPLATERSDAKPGTATTYRFLATRSSSPARKTTTPERRRRPHESR